MKPTRALLIPDLHQDHRFLRRILAQENLDSFAQVVLMGDYFDGRDLDFRGPREAMATARLMAELAARLGPRLTLLWGNHDVPYYAAAASRSESPGKISAARRISDALGVRPESHATAEAVNRILDRKFWRQLQPWVMVGDFLISHAGLHRKYFPGRTRSGRVELDLLLRSWEKSLADLIRHEIAGELLLPGEARGGHESAIGGPTWLDWNREFVDDLPFAQVVAHTPSATTRQRGRSWCIDFGQCAYGVLADELEIRAI